MATGLLSIGIANYEMSRWSLDVGAWAIIWTGFLQGIGAGITILPMQEVAFYGKSSEQRTDASALINLTRSICSSVGVSITFVFYFINSGTARSELIPNVNWFSKAYQGSAEGDNRGQALAQIGEEIDRQASMLGYSGAFLFLALLTLIPLLLLLVVGKLNVGEQK